MHTAFGGVTSRVLGGLAPVVLARYLGPEVFGVYALIISLVGVVAGASHLGQNTALEKFLPEYFVRDRSRGGAILADTVVLVSGTLAVVCAIFYYLSPWIASTIYHRDSLAPAFEFSAFIVLFASLFNLSSSAVAGLQDFKAFSRAKVLRAAAFLLLAWVGAWKFGLYGALGGQLLAYVLALSFLAAVATSLVRKRFQGRFKIVFSRDVLGEIFSFAFPAFLSAMFVAPAYWWANTLLARDSGFEQVGLFGVAFALCRLISVIPSSLSVPAVSFLSEAHAASKADKFSGLVSTNVRLIWALTLPISFGCALLAPWIVRIAFGAAYQRAAFLASLMSFVALIMAVCGVVGYAVAGTGRMWHAFWINGFWLLGFGVSVAILVPGFGAQGLAWGFVISYLLLALGLGAYAVWYLHIRFEGSVVLGILTVGGAILALVLSRNEESITSLAAAVSGECVIVMVVWTVILKHSERTGLMGWARGVLRLRLGR